MARYRVQVLERAMALLDALGAANREVGPAELAGMLHLHKSTIHRLLKVLEGYRFVRRNPHGKYDLGLKLFELGNMSVSRFSLPRRAEPFLKEVVSRTGETAQICVLNNIQMVSIANADAPWLLRAIGHRGELHSSASGKAFLAFLPRPAQDLLLSRLTLTKFTHNTIATLPALKSELARVRRRGLRRQQRRGRTGRAMHRRADLRPQLARDRDAEYRRSRVSHDQRSCSRAGSHRCERRQCTVIRTGTSRRRFVGGSRRCPACWDALTRFFARHRGHHPRRCVLKCGSTVVGW